MSARRNRNATFDVDFVAEKSERHAEIFAKFLLQLFDFGDCAAAKFGRDARQSFVGVVACQRDRNDGGRDDFRIMRSQIAQSFFELFAVVNFWAENDLRVNFDVVFEQRV